MPRPGRAHAGARVAPSAACRRAESADDTDTHIRALDRGGADRWPGAATVVGAVARRRRRGQASPERAARRPARRSSYTVARRRRRRPARPRSAASKPASACAARAQRAAPRSALSAEPCSARSQSSGARAPRDARANGSANAAHDGSRAIARAVSRRCTDTGSSSGEGRLTSSTSACGRPACRDARRRERPGSHRRTARSPPSAASRARDSCARAARRKARPRRARDRRAPARASTASCACRTPRLACTDAGLAAHLDRGIASAPPSTADPSISDQHQRGQDGRRIIDTS